MKELFRKISQLINNELVTASPILGGDISTAYLLSTTVKNYFLKVNEKTFAFEMFLAERDGLQAIKESKAIDVPTVYLVDKFEGKSFLLMDFIPTKSPNATDFRKLGIKLAHLHQNTHPNFGFPTNNFIGSLPQNNHYHKDWIEFYWLERILPQLQIALRNKELTQNDIPKEAAALKIMYSIFGEVTPSLLHGDLWNGNFLISENGTPYLIDPAAYYGHSMIDIAMSKLFGGLHPDFYAGYHDIIPKSACYDEQIELYQLYYLLVHLNLFGGSYRAAVVNILKRYFY